MNIFVSGVNYKTTPLETRENLSFTIEEQKKALEEIRKLPGVDECAILSTCNRTEAYVYSEDRDFNNDVVERLLCSLKGVCIYDMKKYFYVYSSTRAVKHLFKVACGMDSLVIGEDQILGQVKGAYDLSLEMGSSRGVLNTLFREVITAAKKVKTFTGISRNNISVGSLAVKLVGDIFQGKLEDKCVLVIGTGKIGSLVLKNLSSRGFHKIYITNRTHGKTGELSKAYENVLPVSYNDRYSVIDECDVVISSTASPHYTITRDMLEKSLACGKERIFIDLAVPRDFDTAIKELAGVRYFNIDDLQSVIGENMDKRAVEMSRAEKIINEYVMEFEKWYEFRGVLPVVREIQKFTEEMLNEKITRTLARLKCASEEDRDIVKASMTSTINEILNKFIYSVREYASKEDLETYFRCLGDAMKNE